MALTPPQTMLVWAQSGDLWFGPRELLLPKHDFRPVTLTLSWGCGAKYHAPAFRATDEPFIRCISIGLL